MRQLRRVTLLYRRLPRELWRDAGTGLRLRRFGANGCVEVKRRPVHGQLIDPALQKAGGPVSQLDGLPIEGLAVQQERSRAKACAGKANRFNIKLSDLNPLFGQHALGPCFNQPRDEQIEKQAS